jgi:hypothetical protein
MSESSSSEQDNGNNDNGKISPRINERYYD